ncbi:MAG: AmmeMemoRadiSam system radical SAM enzyme [Candidatus Thermoplasmatota archaeon]
MKKKARFWETIKDSQVECKLCNQNCKIKNNQTGFCGVRKNEGQKLYTLIYGSCSSVAVDPIEKKPLYHFKPGTKALSLGTVGCNFRCMHCQNATISRASPDDFPYMKNYSPEEIVSLAKDKGCEGIAWTYNEPGIWYEFSFDTAKLAHEEGLYNVYVTNGYIQEEPLREIAPYLDALNIDVKAFNNDFYKEVCKARLKPVLESCELSKKLGLHLEVTYLIIPGYNDSEEEIQDFCSWVTEKLGEETPVHFSRFHPDYKMRDVSMTSIETMNQAHEIAKESGIQHPYLGNVPPGKHDNTFCPNCNNICISRRGFSAQKKGLKESRCSKCGCELSLTI